MERRGWLKLPKPEMITNKMSGANFTIVFHGQYG
jgi:hypothetical protein